MRSRPTRRKPETKKTCATVEIRSAFTFDVIETVVGPADRRPCHMMTLRSRRRRRVDCMAALHADCGRRRAGTPPAPPRHMRLLVGEIMVDRGRARGGQRVLEDGSSKKKSLCGVSEAISSRVCWETSCVSMVYVRENPFFHPCFSGKRLRQTARHADVA